MALINLHTHSTHSDGTLTPKALAGEAASAGIKYFSLTDHDAVGGWREMEPALKEHGISCCYGVEISAGPDEYSSHILGYGINPADPVLTTRLAGFRDRRITRLKKILALLKPLGIEIAFEDLSWRGSCPPDRQQVADLMLERQLVPSRTQALKRYFAPGAPAYVKLDNPAVAEAIRIIKDAGGKAVLAHPYTLGRSLDLPRLKDAGLDGIEAFYPVHTEAATHDFISLAKRYGLFITAGTDFHGPGTKRDKMGGFEYSDDYFSEVKKLFT